MGKYIQVETTTDSSEVANKIARSVLDKQLAACVQLRTCVSMFRWKGKIEQADEFNCVMKSREDLYQELKEAIRESHNYEVPEIIATEVRYVGDAYRAWLDQELQKPKQE